MVKLDLEWDINEKGNRSYQQYVEKQSDIVQCCHASICTMRCPDPGPDTSSDHLCLTSK